MKSNSFGAFHPLWTEQSRLIARGVRAIAIVEGLSNDCARENVALLLEAAQGQSVYAFSFGRHLSGYASHVWAIELLRWVQTISQIQRNRILGLLLGYGPEAIKQFEHLSTTVDYERDEEEVEPYNPETKVCPQGCGGALDDKYHGAVARTDAANFVFQCNDFEVPHMHRQCNNCGYAWPEKPPV